MRMTVDLADEQVGALAEYCGREGVSRTQAVERALAALLQGEEAESRERPAALEAAFGMWKDRGIDGVDYQRQLRPSGSGRVMRWP